MAEITTPIEFMHQLMYKLSHTYQDDENKLNLALADLTDIEGKEQITDWTQLRDMIKADITTNLNNGGTAKDFLKKYCNIDLDNDDCGALIGFDCSGGEILTNDNIINEEGDLQTHPASAEIRGCTVSFPTFSDSKYNYVMDGLYTWWIGLPFDLVKESYELEFNEDSFVTTMPIDLFDEPPSGGMVVGAYVDSSYRVSTGITTALELKVNMNDAAFGTIIIGDKSGNTTSGWFASLDRILAHELTHAVMSTNIRGFTVWLPDWFCEGGTAELVNGCDDSRTSDLMQAAVSTAIIDDGFSASPTLAREYSVGFIAMRYLLKKYTDRRVHIHFPVKPKEPFEKVWEKMAHGIRSEHCISMDGDLNKIMDEFIDFCQRDDYNLVQPWTLCSNKGSKTLRIPLEGHEKKTEDAMCTYVSSISVILSNACYLSNNFVAKADDSENELFPGGVKSCFYYNDISSLIDYYNTTPATIWGDVAHIVVIFEGEELTLLSESDYLQLLNTLDSSRLDRDMQSAYLVVVQANLIPFNKYDTLESMSNEEFYSYFTEELSVEAQNRIQWLLSQGAYFVDIRLEELDKCGLSGSSTPFVSSIWKNKTRTHANYPSYYKSSAEDPFNWNNVLVDIINNSKLKSATTNVTKKQSTDFPCFYLSTGVFKPSTWNGQGLDYPSASLKNSNDEYIPFNIHVLNDVNMRFDLQGVGTCKKVTGKEGDANLLNGIRQTGADSYKADKISDVIPGVGCPLIVRSVENKDTYDTILCYFTKTSYSGTFTLIFYDENDEEKPPIFQSVAFGLGITEEESYKYPLYTAGGTSGLYPSYYSFSYTVPGDPPATVTLNIYGNKFNFDMEKGDTLGSLLYPVAIDRCGISNFRVLQSDGQWKSVINLRQYFYKDKKNTCGAYITKNNGDSVEDCLVYPTISDIENVDRFVLVQPVTVIKKHVDGEDESGFLMSINGVKCKPDRLRSMFTALDGHEYLIVPNGWYDRTLGLPLREVSSDESLVDVMIDLLKHMPKQTYVLCVDLG